jgi:DNA primase
MSVTDEIKSRLDIVSYINQYVPLKKSGSTFKACCPFHGEKTPSFVVNEDYQSWRCFGACAEGGDIFSFAMKYHGWEFKEALAELGKQAGVEVQQQTPEQKQRADHADYLRGMLKEAASAYHKKLYDPNDAGAVAALHYARETRGLSDETIRAFGIGYAPNGWDTILNYLTEFGYEQADIIEAGLALRSERSGKVYDRFRQRFMVPIRDPKGRVVGFGGRILNPNDSPKYMNSPQTLVFDKSQLLFGLDLAKQTIRDTETAVIVEGYMDAITAYQAGFHNVVAQMGTAMTEAQLRLIAPKYAKRVVLALDSDAAGQNATRRSLEVARETLASDFTGRLSIDMRVLQIPDAKDPDDLIREDANRWAQLVDSATPVADFVIDMEMSALPAQPSVQEREAVARRVAPILTATENNLYQQENLQKLALRLLIPEKTLLQIAGEVQQEADRKRRYQERRRQEHQAAPPPSTDEDDGPPPLNYNDMPPPAADDDDMPPPLDHSEPVPTQAAPSPRMARPPKPLSASLRSEAHFLNQLLQHPDVYYRINGKFHEAANGDEQLFNRAMRPLGVADFEHTGLRALMAIFLQSMEQDEMDAADYVIAHAGDELREELEIVLTNALEAKLGDPAAVAPGDLRAVLDKMQRSGMLLDPTRDLMAQAIRLRCRRLRRERDEHRLMQTNATHEHDMAQVDSCIRQIDLLGRAVHLLEIQERRVARLY